MILIRCDRCGAEQPSGGPRAGWSSWTDNRVVGSGAHKGVEAEHLDFCPSCTRRLRESLDS